MRKNWMALLLFVFSAPLSAQVVGAMPSHGDTTASLTVPYTIIDLTRPVSVATATLTTATVRWRSGVSTCPNSFRIRFLQQQGNGSYIIVADRGPFSPPTTPVRGAAFTVALNPPVSVVQGDLIAVTVLQPLNPCGGVLLTEASPENTAQEIGGADVQNNVVPASSQVVPGLILNAVAGTGSPMLAGVIPAAGAVAGSNGSFFRTALQLYNPDGAAMSGTFVFHPAGKPAAAGDPSMPFTLAAGNATSFPDVVTQMGTSGLGSLDILTANGVQPIVTARVFNDTPSGTSGFYEEPVDSTAFNDGFRSEPLLEPSDPVNFRMNIGVRTFASGATIDVTAPGTAGVLHKTYPPNYFEQLTAQQFLGGAALVPDSIISISISSGAALIYSSITDNRTNDSAIHYAGK